MTIQVGPRSNMTGLRAAKNKSVQTGMIHTDNHRKNTTNNRLKNNTSSVNNRVKIGYKLHRLRDMIEMVMCNHVMTGIVLHRQYGVMEIRIPNLVTTEIGRVQHCQTSVVFGPIQIVPRRLFVRHVNVVRMIVIMSAIQ